MGTLSQPISSSFLPTNMGPMSSGVLGSYLAEEIPPPVPSYSISAKYPPVPLGCLVHSLDKALPAKNHGIAWDKDKLPATFFKQAGSAALSPAGKGV